MDPPTLQEVATDIENPAAATSGTRTKSTTSRGHDQPPQQQVDDHTSNAEDEEPVGGDVLWNQHCCALRDVVFADIAQLETLQPEELIDTVVRRTMSAWVDIRMVDVSRDPHPTGRWQKMQFYTTYTTIGVVFFIPWVIYAATASMVRFIHYYAQWLLILTSATILLIPAIEQTNTIIEKQQGDIDYNKIINIVAICQTVILAITASYHKIDGVVIMNYFQFVKYIKSWESSSRVTEFEYVLANHTDGKSLSSERQIELKRKREQIAHSLVKCMKGLMIVEALSRVAFNDGMIEYGRMCKDSWSTYGKFYIRCKVSHILDALDNNIVPECEGFLNYIYSHKGARLVLKICKNDLEVQLYRVLLDDTLTSFGRIEQMKELAENREPPPNLVGEVMRHQADPPEAMRRRTTTSDGPEVMRRRPTTASATMHRFLSMDS